MHQKSKKIILIGLTLGAVNDYLRSRHISTDDAKLIQPARSLLFEF